MAHKAKTFGQSRGSARHSRADVPALQQRATRLYQAGQLAEALETCRQILALEPDRPDVLGFAGKAFQELGFEGDDLDMRVRLFVGFHSGERQIFGADKKAAQRYRERRLELLLSPQP